jgi:predicted alpha/beta-hydrolase family hydrolase
MMQRNIIGVSMIEETLFHTQSGSELPAILNLPTDADTLFVLGHGSGSTIHVPLMAALSEVLGSLRIATLRFEYPYSCHPDFVPFTDMPVDDDEVLIETVRAALTFGMRNCPELKTFVGGHSISGLVTTYADADVPLPAAGIISLGYPRKGDPIRSQHLPNTAAPILIVQGTNDALGSRNEIEEMTRPLGDRASLRWIVGATHGFSVDGRELSQVALDIAGTVRQFVDSA